MFCIIRGRFNKLAWFADVDTLYTPMNWGNGHWVVLAVDLKESSIAILDLLISARDEKKVETVMKPLLQMLPAVILSHGITHTQPFSPFVMRREAVIS